jgi:hypothetical protein
MKKNILFVILAGWAALLVSCQSEEVRNLREFYYPLEELSEGLVYEYTSAGDEQDPPFYWYFRSFEQPEGTFLTGMYYDYRYTPFQFIREEAVSNGMLTVDYSLYDMDSTGKQTPIPVEVAAGNVFPFEMADTNSVYLFKISFENPPVSDTLPPTTTTLIRNRQFAGDTTVVFQGETYEAVQFYVRELVDIAGEGHAEHEYDGTEVYAKGIGLVYFTKNISETFFTEYRLNDRFLMTELERRFGETLQNQ